MHHNDSKIFYDEVDRLLNDPKVRGMSSFSQHKGTNTLRHSIKVAQASFKLAEHLGWDIDERELARGALLHDYYQYDIQGRTDYFLNSSNTVWYKNVFNASENELQEVEGLGEKTAKNIKKVLDSKYLYFESEIKEKKLI